MEFGLVGLTVAGIWQLLEYRGAPKPVGSWLDDSRVRSAMYLILVVAGGVVLLDHLFV